MIKFLRRLKLSIYLSYLIRFKDTLQVKKGEVLELTKDLNREYIIIEGVINTNGYKIYATNTLINLGTIRT